MSVRKQNPSDTVLTRGISFLALGDSYTIGEGVAASGRWPVQLAEALHQSGLDVSDLSIIARTGWTTDELADAMGKADLQNGYDLVSLAIGVNNQYRGRPLDEFRAQYADLLRRAVNLAGKCRRVFVLSIPDWTITPFAQESERDLVDMGREMAAFNRALAEETAAQDVIFFDITPSTLAMADDVALITEDGLHPSALLYSRWIEQIVGPVTDLLKYGRLRPL